MKQLIAHLRRLKLKMLRDRMPVRRVAAGWAIGMFIGCTVPFGCQLIVSIPLSIVTKTSRVGATLGTFITNPFTIFIIYPVQTWVGSRVMGVPLGWEQLTEICTRLAGVSLFSGEGWQVLSEVGLRVLGSFLLGGLLFALVCTPLTYFGVARFIAAHRRRFELRRRLRRERKRNGR